MPLQAARERVMPVVAPACTETGSEIDVLLLIFYDRAFLTGAFPLQHLPFGSPQRVGFTPVRRL